MVSKAKKEGSTSERILAAATEIFANRGYHGTSMSAITKAAGVNKALIFYYFDSKEGLFDAVVTRVYKQQRDALMDIKLKADLDPRQRIHALIDFYWDFLEQHPEVLYLSLHELARPDGQHQVIGQQNRMIFEFLRAQMDSFVTEFPTDVEHMFLSISGAIVYPFAYARVLTNLEEHYTSTPEAKQKRREHVHWLLELVLQQVPLKAKE
jgi:AcrR family transcriptional regulator